jgi:hypothetical protein
VTTTVLIYFLHPSKRMANVANTGVASESLNDVAAMESSYELSRQILSQMYPFNSLKQFRYLKIIFIHLVHAVNHTFFVRKIVVVTLPTKMFAGNF